MADNARYCTNCRAPLPRSATACPNCGTFAGDVFDGRRPTKKRRIPWLELFVLVVVAAGAAVYWSRRQPRPRFDSGPIHVVNRPGGARRAEGAEISEPEAVRLLRQQFPTINSECLVTMSRGVHGDAYVIEALNRCDGTKLGRWSVDSKTRLISRD